MKPKRIETLPQFIAEIESIAYAAGQRTSRVFDDWLTMIVCALSMGSMEELYMKTVKHYAEKNKDLPHRLSRLFAELALAMEGRRDMLGDIFMEAVSRGHNGQFFTPMEICRLMAQVSGVPASGTPSVNDPACGSGRCLLAVAEINPKCIFVGQDNDHACARMLAVNLSLNGLSGFAIHGNTLTNEIWNIYRIGMPGFPGVIYRVSYEHMCHYLDRRKTDDQTTSEENGTGRKMLRSAAGIHEQRNGGQAIAKRASRTPVKLDACSAEGCHVPENKTQVTFSQPLLFEDT